MNWPPVEHELVEEKGEFVCTCKHRCKTVEEWVEHARLVHSLQIQRAMILNNTFDRG